MAGERQTIPARHGIATFVPKGHSIKIINTYGTQVVDTWAFALHGTPYGEPEADEKAAQEEFEKAEQSIQEQGDKKQGIEEQAQKNQGTEEGTNDAGAGAEKVEEQKPKESESVADTPSKDPKEKQETATKDDEQKDNEENKAKESEEKATTEKGDAAEAQFTEEKPKEENEKEKKEVNKNSATDAVNEAIKPPSEVGKTPRKGWSSYVPSLRGRTKGPSTDATDASKEQSKPTKGSPKDKQSPKETSPADSKATKPSEEDGKTEKSDDDNADNKSIKSTKSSRTWGSYIPSIRNRSKGESPQEGESGATPPQDNEKGKKGWLSYLPSGTSFTSYLPSQGTISAFAASHHRDPSKSYAEQLYEFSRTPVGAASISAATGSGTAGSLYAAYTAYTKLQSSQHPSNSMEYLSLPHTFAATHHLSPIPGDTLLTNLRAPLLTLIEDTSPLPQRDEKQTDSAGIAGRHGTLLPACDPRVYKQLGLDQNEERGSCAENLVMALRELNQEAGLQGPKAVGADVTVNYAPTPLSLFMNLCIEAAAQQGNLDDRDIPTGKEESQDPKTDASCGHVSVKEPRTYEGGIWGKLGEKGGYVKFRAEKDVVVVMSACPMEVGPVNGGRCRAANFVVEEPEEVRRKREEEERQKNEEMVREKAERKKLAEEKKEKKKKQAEEKKEQVEMEKARKRRDSGQSDVEKESKAAADIEGDKKDEKAESAPEAKTEGAPEPKAEGAPEPKPEEQSAATSGTETPKRNAPKPGKKKPRKLEKRG